MQQKIATNLSFTPFLIMTQPVLGRLTNRNVVSFGQLQYGTFQCGKEKLYNTGVHLFREADLSKGLLLATLYHSEN